MLAYHVMPLTLANSIQNYSSSAINMVQQFSSYLRQETAERTFLPSLYDPCASSKSVPFLPQSIKPLVNLLNKKPFFINMNLIIISTIDPTVT